MDFANFDAKVYWKTLQKERKDAETVVFSSTFSPDGEYLICGSNFGFINLWSISSVLVTT
jgi:hypothetical protein